MSENDKGETSDHAIVVKVFEKAELRLSKEVFDTLAAPLVGLTNAPSSVLSVLFPGWDASKIRRAATRRTTDLIEGRVEAQGPLDELLLEQARTYLLRESNVVRAVERAGALRDQGYKLAPAPALPALPPGNDSEQPGTLPEWFARWRRAVEDVTTPAMQNLYAKLLAGELESPTAFSMRTLSVVHDLDQRIAEMFQDLEPVTMIGGGAIPSLKHLMTTTAFQPLGMRPIKMMRLRDAGLITSAQDATLDLSIVQKDDGRYVAAMWIGHEWFLFWFPIRVRQIEKQLPVENLTIAGSELLRILRPADRAARMPVISWVAAMIAGLAHVNLSEVEVRALPFETPKAGPGDGELVNITI
jgi:hypothetical protein